MKYKNERIRKKLRSAAQLAAAGVLMCLAAVLMITTAFISANKAKNSVLPVAEILSMDANHAARPASFEIDREPVLAASSEDEDYYLLTNGDAHILSGMTDESYQKVMADYAAGDRRIEGVTKVLIDDRARSEAAAALSDMFGKDITAKTLDEYTGDVHLRVTEITAWQMVKEIYVLYIAFAVPLLLIGLIILGGGLSNRAVSGAEGVTPEILDEQANSADAVWVESFEVYLAPEYIIGTTNGITALRYNDLKRVVFTAITGGVRKDRLAAETADGRTYMLGEARVLTYADGDSIADKDLIFDICAERSPSMCRLSFRFPFCINMQNSNGEVCRTAYGSEAYSCLDGEDMEEMRADFRRSEPERLFGDGRAVQYMSLDFLPDGHIVVHALVERERKDELRQELESFVSEQLPEGYRGGLWSDKAGEFILSFRTQR